MVGQLEPVRSALPTYQPARSGALTRTLYPCAKWLRLLRRALRKVAILNGQAGAEHFTVHKKVEAVLKAHGIRGLNCVLDPKAAQDDHP